MLKYCAEFAWECRWQGVIRVANVFEIHLTHSTQKANQVKQVFYEVLEQYFAVNGSSAMVGTATKFYYSIRYYIQRPAEHVARNFIMLFASYRFIQLFTIILCLCTAELAIAKWDFSFESFFAAIWEAITY